MGPARRAGAGPGEERHALAAARWLAHGDALRLNLRPRAHALQAIDYDRLARRESRLHHPQAVDDGTQLHGPVLGLVARAYDRSEEHTSEPQSQSNLVCRLLLEKKKTSRHREAITIYAGTSPTDSVSLITQGTMQHLRDLMV